MESKHKTRNHHSVIQIFNSQYKNLSKSVPFSENNPAKWGIKTIFHTPLLVSTELTEVFCLYEREVIIWNCDDQHFEHDGLLSLAGVMCTVGCVLIQQQQFMFWSNDFLFKNCRHPTMSIWKKRLPLLSSLMAYGVGSFNSNFSLSIRTVR